MPGDASLSPASAPWSPQTFQEKDVLPSVMPLNVMGQLKNPLLLINWFKTMLHRHLNHQRFTLAGIDDVIARGKRRDWAELRVAALSDPAVMMKISRVCGAYREDLMRNGTISGGNMPKDILPEWEQVITLFDLEETGLAKYKDLDPRWHDWAVASSACRHCATIIFDRIVGLLD